MEDQNQVTNCIERTKQYISSSHRKKITIIISVIIVCGILLPTLLTGCNNSLESKDQLFDELVRQIPATRNTYSPSVKQAIEDVNNALIKLGLDNTSEPVHIDEPFMELYLESHTKDELFNNLFKIYEYIDERYGEISSSYKTLYIKLDNIIETATKICDIPMQQIDFSKRGAEGFYSQHTESYPLSRTWTVEGKFYNETGENEHYETRSCKATFSYYGDFAVENESGYKYIPDKYGWYYGHFFNELPHWEEYNEFYLGYKGKVILNSESEYWTENMFWSHAESLRFFYVGENIYFLYTRSQYDDNNREFWEQLVWERMSK